MTKSRRNQTYETRRIIYWMRGSLRKAAPLIIQLNKNRMGKTLDLRPRVLIEVLQAKETFLI